MKNLFLVFAILALLISTGYAAVVLESDGVQSGAVETLNIVGPTVSVSGKTGTITSNTITGTMTVSGDIYADTGLSVDGSIYLTGGDGMDHPLLIAQPGGGCSQCGVDAGGTNWFCQDVECPAGMTQ